MTKTILVTCDIRDTDDKSDNQEPEFMTIFVAWKLWHWTAFAILAMVSLVSWQWDPIDLFLLLPIQSSEHCLQLRNRCLLRRYHHLLFLLLSPAFCIWRLNIKNMPLLCLIFFWHKGEHIVIEEEMICSISSQTECLPVRTGYFLYTQYLLWQSIFFLNTTQFYFLSSLSQLRYIWDMWKIDRSRKRRMNKEG